MGLWRDIYERFDPEEPAKPEWRSPRPYSPVLDIDRALERGFGDRRFLVLGTVGTGKFTELEKIAALRTRSELVMVMDLHRHFEARVGDPAALQNLQAWEVVFLAGIHIIRGVEEVFSHVWTKERLEELKKARAAFDEPGSGAPVVDIAKLAQAVIVGVGGGTADAVAKGLISVLGEAASSVTWTSPVGLPGRSKVPDQDLRVTRMLDAVNALIAEFESTYFRRLTLIVDGLDRVTNLQTNRSLWVESSVLGRLSCASVISASIVLREEGMGLSLRSFALKILANIPVLDREHPGRPSDQVDFFADVFDRRVRDLPGGPDAIPRALLDRLAYYSGGRIREFVRFVRGVAERAHDAGVEQASPAIVEEVIDEWRRAAELGVTSSHVRTLESVMRDPRRLLPDDSHFGELVGRFWLLPYPNESVRWYPHPLLTLKLLHAGSSGSTDS